ncbi:unnamed protein product [Prunus armeniaca]|uniref:UBC core domain-containing protein n=1 Tax=Prunus armeniaca TaxID=36596 RepID=A0A6J5X787_PRUAR|nr:unnamed protein product [Prunus armeniaca]
MNTSAQSSSSFVFQIPLLLSVDRVESAEMEQNQIEIFQGEVSEEYKQHTARTIQRELEEMQSNPCDDFKCLALESNPRYWQFAIRGPKGTEFAGGIYHGQVKIPEEYPKEPPVLSLLTENGRFKTQTMRDALLALITLLPRYPNDKSGSVEYDKEERRRLATESREAAPIFGTDDFRS